MENLHIYIISLSIISHPKIPLPTNSSTQESALMPHFRNCKVKSEYFKMVKQNSQFQLPEKVNHHVPFFVFSEHYAKLASLDLVLHPVQ